MFYKLTLNTDSHLEHSGTNKWKRGDEFIVPSTKVFSINNRDTPCRILVIEDLPCLSSWFIIEALDENLYGTKELTLEAKEELDIFVKLIITPDDAFSFKGKYFSVAKCRLLDLYGECIMETNHTLNMRSIISIHSEAIAHIMGKLKSSVTKNDSGEILIDGAVLTNSWLRLVGSTLFKSDLTLVLESLPSKEGKEIGKILKSLNTHYRPLKAMRNISLVNENKGIRFLPDGKSDEEKNYQEMKLGRLFSKLNLHNGEIKKSVIEQFINDVIGLHINNCNFKEVTGEDIRHFYLWKNNVPKQGTMDGSCMKGEQHQKYFDIYCANPEVCSMIVLLTEDGKHALGRALLWKTDGGITLMDRVYGVDATIAKFKAYAMHKQYWYKLKQTYDNAVDWITPDGETKTSQEFTITLKTDHKYFPYMDTFPFCGNGWISNTSSSDYIYENRNTSGGHVTEDEEDDEENRTWDDIDECYIDDEDDVRYVESRSIYTHCDNVTFCEHNDTYELCDDCVELFDGTYARDNNAIYCDENETYCLLGEQETSVYSDILYIREASKFMHIEEFDETILESEEEEFYEAKGYELNQDGLWVKKEETKEN